MPTLLVLDADGRERLRMTGLIEAGALAEELSRIARAATASPGDQSDR
jgi:hypothetical protein